MSEFNFETFFLSSLYIYDDFRTRGHRDFEAEAQAIHQRLVMKKEVLKCLPFLPQSAKVMIQEKLTKLLKGVFTIKKPAFLEFFGGKSQHKEQKEMIEQFNSFVNLIENLADQDLTLSQVQKWDIIDCEGLQNLEIKVSCSSQKLSQQITEPSIQQDPMASLSLNIHLKRLENSKFYLFTFSTDLLAQRFQELSQFERPEDTGLPKLFFMQLDLGQKQVAFSPITHRIGYLLQEKDWAESYTESPQHLYLTAGHVVKFNDDFEIQVISSWLDGFSASEDEKKSVKRYGEHGNFEVGKPIRNEDRPVLKSKKSILVMIVRRPSKNFEKKLELSIGPQGCINLGEILMLPFRLEAHFDGKGHFLTTPAPAYIELKQKEEVQSRAEDLNLSMVLRHCKRSEIMVINIQVNLREFWESVMV